MKLITAFFDRHGSYSRLCRVMEKSAARWMPDMEIHKIQIIPPDNSDQFRDTYHGFMPAAEAALLADGPVAVVDVDMMFTGRVDDLPIDFDLAFTVRSGRFRYNTGLWFSSGSPVARKFIARWMQNTVRVYYAFTMDTVYQHGGIDQQSLADTIAEMPEVRIKLLPCQEWNCEQTEWRNRSEKTRVIHIKSGLRPLCLGTELLQPKHAYLKPIIDEWREYDRDT